MAEIDLEPRFAHAIGPAVCAYTTDGSHLITGGGDSMIRVFNASLDKRDTEAKTIDQHSEAIRTIAVHKDNFATAGDDGVVALFRSATATFEKLLVRSTVPVRCLAYSNSGSKIAIAADEDIIRIVLVRDISKVIILRGHTRSVRYVAFDPLGDYLISSGCEGDVRIWDIEPAEGEARCIQTLSSITKAVLPDSMLQSTVAWKPDGSCFAFPGKNGVIHVYSRTVWIEIYTLDNGHVDDVITLAWSPNGQYLASTAMDNQVIIWNVSKKAIVRKYITAVHCTGISWHPTSNELAFTDADGMFTLWDDVIPLNQGFEHPAQNLRRISNKELANLFEDDDDLDGEVDVSRRVVEEEKGENVEDDIDMMSEMDDFVIDDDGAGYAETGQERERRTRAPAISRGTLGTHSIVNVEFHDHSQYRNFHFTDYLNYSMGAVGEKGAVFAVEGSNEPKKRHENEEESEDDGEEEREEQKGANSMLHYRPLSNWANNAEWTVQLPKGENVLSIAINNVSVIATTSAGYVRIFSLSGVQRHIFRLDSVVTVAGAADLAFFVYSVGPCFKEQHNLEFLLMNTDTCEILQKDKVPISKNSELTWAGFSETTGSNEHPFFPRPAVSDIELQMPTLQVDSDSGRLEEQYLRTHIMTLHERDEAEATGTEDEYYKEFSRADMEMDKALLQLIQLACKADKVQRALDLASALHSSRSVDAAIKIATFHHITSLAERFTRIKESKFMGGEDILRRSVSLADSQASRPRIYESSQQSLSGDLAFIGRVENTLQHKRSVDEPMDEDEDMSPVPKRTRPDNPFRVSSRS
ncbi:hypothetical protein DFQ29_005463 [Apophysomyces sp. BC1021]|nr:hypothetical protein DFQ29_005463 [Apophysomyces sp. BC1021]